jgi:hypothetical protein
MFLKYSFKEPLGKEISDLQESFLTLYKLIDWLIIYCFTSRSRIFHLYGDVTIKFVKVIAPDDWMGPQLGKLFLHVFIWGKYFKMFSRIPGRATKATIYMKAF